MPLFFDFEFKMNWDRKLPPAGSSEKIRAAIRR